MTETNLMMEHRPPLAMRLWRRLGFRYGARCERPDDDEARYTIHRVCTYWDWRDRLRILVSGQTEIELCVETERFETIKGTRQEAAVLAPGARFQSGVRKPA